VFSPSTLASGMGMAFTDEADFTGLSKQAGKLFLAQVANPTAS
jgi:hypothetical protein